VYQPGEGLLAARSRVLVAVINSHQDFHIARDQGWYRIPVARAPRRLGAEFLAFYQTKAFQEEGWAVNYYSPIKRYRLAHRRTLLPQEADHPRANDLYYKIEIGPLLRLPRPIPSLRLRRITFIPTTLERLLQAEEINDLWCGTWEEERLWHMFKDGGLHAERRYPLREDDPEYCLDFALFCKQGKVGVCLLSEPAVQNVRMVRESAEVGDYDLAARGWDPVRLHSKDIEDSVHSCLVRILEVVQRRGGMLVPAEAPVGQE